MAADVDICNLALSHFGQDASIDSISPPDGSIEAEHCARFYPLSVAELLAGSFDWAWARGYARLPQLENDRSEWAYRYTLPTGCLALRSVLPEGFSDADQDSEPFERVGDSLYCNAAGATLRYTRNATDPSKFPPLFTIGLSWLLASYISGPIVKDPTGRTQSSLRAAADREIAKAQAADANGDKRRAAYMPTARRTR